MDFRNGGVYDGLFISKEIAEKWNIQDGEFRYFVKKAEYQEPSSLVMFGLYPKMRKTCRQT